MCYVYNITIPMLSGIKLMKRKSDNVQKDSKELGKVQID